MEKLWKISVFNVHLLVAIFHHLESFVRNWEVGLMVFTSRRKVGKLRKFNETFRNWNFVEIRQKLRRSQINATKNYKNSRTSHNAPEQNGSKNSQT